MRVLLRRWLPTVVTTLIPLAVGAHAHGWGEDGHAIITELAIDRLPAEMPDWLKTPEVRARLAYLSAEPDRWRGQNAPVLNHANGPDHYLDVEQLAPYGLTLETLPRFRTAYTDLMAAQRARTPEAFKPHEPAKDKDYTKLSPGLLPYAIAETELKLAASWTQLRTFEAHRNRVTDAMIDNARQNIVYHMGILSHYVGDGAQPLHLTQHHHGWEGPNPAGYTTDHKLHAYIDSGVIDEHRIYYETLAARAKPAQAFSSEDPWREINACLGETFQQVEPLYILEKTGDLKNDPGKAFIEERLLDGAAALAGLWGAAFRAAAIDDYRVRQLQSDPPKKVPGHAPSPAPQ